MRRQAAQHFKEQIEFGVPTAAAEASLRQLARQLRARKARVKLFLRYPLHAKLYLVRRADPITPLIGYLGSSNLTLAGLSRQGELNVDVVEQDAAEKLQQWFNDRWDDRFSFDISDELAELIETSWASERLVAPYHVYLKMAYHLCEEAREDEREFKLPKVFQGKLLDFQAAAVSLAAHHLHRRDGVLLGDVVGLGKTLMATAVAKIFQEDDDSNTLIICPPKLQEMWEWHVREFDLTATVRSLGKVIKELPNLRRYRLVIIDESHNLRNREGRRYAAIRDYIEQNDSRVLLLTATPYNKQFTDLSNQLRLFLDEDQDLRVRPERFFQWWAEQGWNEADFVTRFQASPRSLRAFEQSESADDWRDLMRLFLVRRTRQFIMRNYAQFDEGKRRYFVLLNGKPFYFPARQPKTLKFALDESDPNDQYARLYHEKVVEVIENLALPRYGLANYLVNDADKLADANEKSILDNLNRAGRRLIGFCRTNLFKRLESSGFSFLLSLRRHILRNMVTLHALENGSPVPIGTQTAAMLDTLVSDVDEEFAEEEEEEEGAEETGVESQVFADDLESYRSRAAQAYENYRAQFRRRFHWLDPKFFSPQLKEALLADAQALLSVLRRAGAWQPDRDAKLDALHRLLTKTHAKDKVLVFTQFADTALYLTEQLKARGVNDVEVVASLTRNPVALARRFGPESNGGLREGETELRVLIATDVLAEGQNLQDAHIVVNFDLPWAIIRLIQRAGRVDRIGQKHDTISVYSFLPAEGVEKIIQQQQTELGGEVTPADKQNLRNRLKELEDELNRYLAEEYQTGLSANPKAYAQWLRSHKPFHWFIEFYGIIKSGGFDVIIGNPPYVEYKDVQKQYTVRGLETQECGDLYAFVMERSSNLLEKHGRMGMIVPVSIVSTDGFNSLRDFMRRTNQISWGLSFANRPSKLFTGVEKRLTIWLACKAAATNQLFLSNYRRWFAEERDFLFSQISFVPKADDCELVGTAIPKIATPIEAQILARLSKQKRLDSFFVKNSSHIVYYTRKVGYFVQFFDFIPSITDSRGKRIEPSELKEILLSSTARRDVVIAILNSSLFFWFFSAYSDVRNVNRREIEAFRCSIDAMDEKVTADLRRLCKSLMKDFNDNSKFITNNYGKFGVLKIQSFQPRLSKPLIDEIDRVLASHYGFTDEELDFIINYDIKYRMGREAGEENDG